jgi:hypothetical protein
VPTRLAGGIFACNLRKGPKPLRVLAGGASAGIQKTAPSTEQSGEGGASNFGRWPMGGLRSVASEIQKSYRDSPQGRLARGEKERSVAHRERNRALRSKVIF